MAGKKGRSGRSLKAIANGSKSALCDITEQVHKGIQRYVRYLNTIEAGDWTGQQAQQMITLHMKHAPNPEGSSEGGAMDALKQMAIEGAKEYARVKAMKHATLHTNILKEVQAAEDEPIDITPARDTAND